MRRFFTFIFAVALFLVPIGVAGQIPGYAESMGFQGPMVFQRTVEKPGMSADDLFRAFMFPKTCSRFTDLHLAGGSSILKTVYSEGISYRDINGLSISYDYKIYIDNGYYTVKLTDVLIQGKGRSLVLCCINGQPFKDQYSRKQYKIATEVAAYVQTAFDDICENLENKVFGINLVEN